MLITIYWGKYFATDSCYKQLSQIKGRVEHSETNLIPLQKFVGYVQINLNFHSLTIAEINIEDMIFKLNIFALRIFNNHELKSWFPDITDMFMLFKSKSDVNS